MIKDYKAICDVIESLDFRNLSPDQFRAELEPHLRSQYQKALNPPPAWPMQLNRVRAIYGTVKRTIRNSTERDKEALFEQLIDTADDFGRNWEVLTESQRSFDMWFNRQLESLQAMPFHWTDSWKTSRNHMTLGLSQKFINLMPKDWWCLKGEQLGANCAVLHAPFDNVVWDKLRSLTRIDLPSLRQGGIYRGFYVCLSRADYDKYQAHLTSSELARALRIPSIFCRIEVDQILWGS